METKIKLSKVKNFIREVSVYFISSNASNNSAALSYYTLFSFIPLIVIFISIIGFFLGDKAGTIEINNFLQDILGNNYAAQIQKIIEEKHLNYSNFLNYFLSFLLLIYSASGMFVQIHNSFNEIWNIKVKPKNTVFYYVTKHLGSILTLLGVFFVILISTLISSFLIKFSNNIHINVKTLYFIEHILSFFTLSISFSIMYKYLNDAIIHWKVIIIGGFFTSFLFIIGKIAISLYLGLNNYSSTFGSASAVILLMLWVYYISQIIFFGASFIKVLNDRLK